VLVASGAQVVRAEASALLVIVVAPDVSSQATQSGRTRVERLCSVVP
jgi:hypothetical protein